MGRAVTGAYEAPRHKAANWVGRGRGRKSTRPGASGVVELSPFEFFDRRADAHHKPRSHDTSRVTWAKLMARVGEEFPFACPGCGGDIRLIAFITDPGPIRKILAHLGEPLEPPPVSPARGPPTDWGELVQPHDDREAVQVSPDELPDIDIHSL